MERGRVNNTSMNEGRNQRLSMMDSRSLRLPFSVSSSRSSYKPPSTSSSSLGSSRLYGRERVPSTVSLPRASSALKADLDYQSSCHLSSPRDYSSSNSRSTSWKLPSSLAPSTTSYERSWTDSHFSSRSKLSDSETRLGTHSGLLKTNNDGDSKRAKLSCSIRGSYTRTPSTSATRSTYSTNGLGSGTGAGEKQSDTRLDSTLSSCRILYQSPSSSSSKPLLSRRELEMRHESRFSGLGESRVRTPGLSSSLYQPDRVTSTYAQGARPKETAYSSSTARESSRSGLSSSSSRSSLVHDFRTTPRSVIGSNVLSSQEPRSVISSSNALSSQEPRSVISSSNSLSSQERRSVISSSNSLSSQETRSVISSSNSLSSQEPRSVIGSSNSLSSQEPRSVIGSSNSLSSQEPRSVIGSSNSLSSQERTRNPESTSVRSSSSSNISSWYTSPLARQETNRPSVAGPPVPRQAPESVGPEGRRSTRRLLSRLFSRRSSQDSSSGSSSARSFDSTDDSPSSGGEVVDAEEGVGNSTVEPDGRISETAQAFAYRRCPRVDLSPIQESHNESHRVGTARSRFQAWRETATSGSNNGSSGGGGGSSWLSSSLSNDCPPLFSRRRGEGVQRSAAGLEDGFFSHPRPSPRRWGEPEHKASEDEEEEENAEEEVGAVGAEVAGANTFLVERTPVTFRPERIASSMLPRHTLYENIFVDVDPNDSVEAKPVPSRDPERLRKIQESLLLEESDEEEGDLCRICQMREELASNPLIEPCSCTGSLQYIHQECIKKWLCSKISSGANLEAILTCELCKEKLHLNIDNFDVNELHRTHAQSEYEFISSGIYLVVLLHLCEQRFSDVLGAANEAGFFNLARTLHEHMDNLGRPLGETDEEDDDDEGVQDNRPSIEFSDLEDDLEEGS